MKTIFVKLCLVFMAAAVLLVGGCKGGDKHDCAPKCNPQPYAQAQDKAYAPEIHIDSEFLQKFYPKNFLIDQLSFAGRSYLSKGCTRISPVENGKTTVLLPPADNQMCPVDDPKSRNSLPGGTSVPGIEFIGRLELKDDKTQKEFLWATAFKVGQQTTESGETYDLIATTCHALQPIIKQDSGRWILKPPTDETLWLDLGERTDYPGEQYQVTELVAYGQQQGLDVALLKVKHFTDGSLQFLPSNVDALRLGRRLPLTVVGYVDFLHPVDPLFDLSYGPFETFGDNEFVSLGRYSQIEFKGEARLNREGVNYLLHDAATSMGESGSPVFAGEDLNKAPVLGVHVCCTAYWKNEKTYAPVDKDMIPCGKITRSGLNKAVSSKDILCDPDLRKALNDYGNSYQCLR
jgi:hypothetical protein